MATTLKITWNPLAVFAPLPTMLMNFVGPGKKKEVVHVEMSHGKLLVKENVGSTHLEMDLKNRVSPHLIRSY